MTSSTNYENKALHFAEIGMYSAAQVFATLALVDAVRNLNKPNGSVVINTTAIPVNRPTQ